MLRIVSVLCLSLLSLSPAIAQKRVALVIGIDRYDNLRPDAQLRKARSDAASVARVLRELAFEVIAADDVTRSAFNSHWQDFLNKLSPGDTAAFYFAGHGVELGGRNYLLPRDVPNLRPGRDELLRRESLSLQEFLADLREKGTGLNLVILDACRDNPFEQVAGRSIGRTRGLVATEPPEGTFIMFSAGTGESALDRLDDADRNPNSVYTRTLLPLLKLPGLTLTDIAEQVREEVWKTAAAVQHRQTPAYYNQVLRRVCLAGGSCSPRAVDASQARGESEAAGAWDGTKDTTSIAVLEAFISRFSDTHYGDLAKVRLNELKEAGAAAKRKAEEDAKAAEAKRQRLAALQAQKEKVGEVNRKRTEADPLRSGRVFRDCPDVCPEMVVVPAGSFIMGPSLSEIAALKRQYPSAVGYTDWEGPQRKVTIAKPFAVGKYEVTFAEWDACAAAGGCKHRPNDMRWGRDRRPVIDVSWDDIVSGYLPWLNGRLGLSGQRGYRLLTEAEWEYAARAGTTTLYAFGDSITRSQAQFSEGTWKSTVSSIEVGSFAPNRWGLHDMHGNVWEWVQDCQPQDMQVFPLEGRTFKKQVCTRAVRGGSWADIPGFHHSAGRRDWMSMQRRYDTGFRLAKTL